MPQVSKKQADEYESCLAAYQEAIAQLNDAVQNFNLAIEEEFANEVHPKIEEVNQAIANLKMIAAEIRDDLQSYYDDRSENWQYGEKGEAYSAWIETFAEIEHTIDDIEMEVPELAEVAEETIEAETSMDY